MNSTTPHLSISHISVSFLASVLVLNAGLTHPGKVLFFAILEILWNFAYKSWKIFGNVFCDVSISGQVDRAYATEMVDSGSILGRVKPKTRKIGSQSFPA